MGVLMLNGIPYSGSPEPPAIYSETEREIGVWIDGKPIYQKTIDFGALPNNTTKTVLHNISNIDKVVNIYGTSWNSSNSYIPLPFVNNVTYAYSSQLELNATGVMIRTSANLSSYANTYVTIQYTKTTDVPGSGKYTPNGGLAHHYSGSEQIIGTWIDGKPLYEKTFVIPCTSTINNSYTYAHNIANYKIGMIEKAFVYDSSNYMTYMFNLADNNDKALSIRIDNTSIIFKGSNTVSADSNRTLYIIAQYTKTTD